ncbi:hypothetical protein TPHA_0G03650 [Tetrapisispora phaffii CBS 4417]|uniref:Decapping nuclease n=1 Tax=Tetrapisispora phaffii (strain ATCC 24235 / CBS 4417 / NBRC 1672 / NRRL Y-8282 / UCD 70-5) TaxID=1071381 RepID=G8BWC7_TETPH|nr:hypothetical protein TPHA_0G03650 [Tetrapisispora phaffii CBS 4417]CCE64205.1 hypothetical protein TPHA_0G03650 [Tetrapisispora phaffii CBS 4417]
MAITSNLFVKETGSTITLKKPKEITYYSRTSNDEFLVNDDSNLNYYYLPDADLDKGLDLNGGYKKFKDYYSEFKDASTLHGLLSSLKDYEQKKNKKMKVDIVTFRGIIRKLIMSSFETNSKYNVVDLRIVLFDGQLFIKDVSTVNAKPEKVTPLEYTGYKFEALCTLPEPLPYVSRTKLNKRPKKIVSHGDEFVSVVKTGVGNCKILLGAEVDAIFDFKEKGKDNLQHYIELKCTAAINNINDTKKFENKLFKTWIQCFLIGITRITYGFRDEQYLLKTIEEFATSDIPLIFKNHNPTLASNCVNAIKWYGVFTEWLMKMIPTEDTSVTKAYRLVCENNHLRLTEIESSEDEYEGLVNGETVISNEFREWRTSLRTQ